MNRGLLIGLLKVSRGDEGIDLLKDKQALQRLTESDEKAKMELSTLTQTNIRYIFCEQMVLIGKFSFFCVC